MSQSQKPEKKIQTLFKKNRECFSFLLTESLYPVVVDLIGKRVLKEKAIKWEHPASFQHGDYSTSLALQVKSDKYLTAWDLANAMVNAWRTQGLPDFIGKVMVAKPGFINVWLKNEVLIIQMNKVIKEKENYGKQPLLTGKKFLLEHTSPNPQTTIMLGHLRNNFLGMTVSYLYEFLGARVVKDCIVNDRGIHLCRAIWGYLVFGRKRSNLTKKELLAFRKVSDSKLEKIVQKTDWQKSMADFAKKKANWWTPRGLGLKPDHANLIWYVLGSRAFKLSKEVVSQVKAILVAWEKGEPWVLAVWKNILAWSEKGYAQTYERVGSRHDHVWYEHKLYQKGKQWVEKGLKKGIFQKSEGAIVSDLAAYGLPDAVVKKADGTALYHTFDLELTYQKQKKFPSDLYLWDIGAEQTLYLKQLFAMCEQLEIGKREDYYHLSYALINFKGGKKMATRTGNVVMADEILDELQARALKIIKKSDQELRGKLSAKKLNHLAETVALGAIKYSLLKFSRETTIQFDFDESLALEGNSGPYLQYTFARTESVLKKAGKKAIRIGSKKMVFKPEETALLRTLYLFPEAVEEAAKNFAPNLLCQYLFDLAQKYNWFYQKRSILNAKSKTLVNFRLALNKAVGQILKNGLFLLGIKTPERM